MALPATVVVAGLTTWWIAARNADSLVADDYYKEGLAINRVLNRQELARSLDMGAELIPESSTIEIRLTGDSDPSALELFLSHPLDANLDQRMALTRILPGIYRGTLPVPPGSRWLWRLEPLGLSPDATWRLDGELVIPDADAR
jgi:hypothetical protein